MVMRVFYDSEFVERGPQLPLQPISFGFVAEDGSELYVINEESLSNLMKHPWLSVNVALSLPILNDQRGVGHFITQWDPDHTDYEHVRSLTDLAYAVHGFLTSFGTTVELWAYYGAFDHVALAQLFGPMSDLPPGIPMFTHELQQLIEQHPTVALPGQTDVVHHALYDARWNRDVFNLLQASSGENSSSTIDPV
jgi:hypothetical protein